MSAQQDTLVMDERSIRFDVTRVQNGPWMQPAFVAVYVTDQHGQWQWLADFEPNADAVEQELRRAARAHLNQWLNLL